MKQSDYIIILLLMLSCGAGYLYLLFPGNTPIHPFIYSEKEIYFHWYIWLMSTSLRMCILSGIILIGSKEKMHLITMDVVMISFLIVIFELIWLILYYDNPFHIPEAAIKVAVVGVVYLSIYSLRHAKHNNSIRDRGDVRGAN
jgi:uncharacterized membrane protein